MSLTTIYRIEKDGEGCYKNYTSWQKGSHTAETNKPGPFEDIKLRYKILENDISLKNYLFGFKDLKQLKKWFNTVEIKNLFERGYQIKEIKIKKEDIIFGSKQIIFRKESCKEN